MSGYNASNIRSIEDYFQGVVKECLIFGWRKREIEAMMLNALDRETTKGTESKEER